ncbi:hypothetical protein TraAM80_04097 [Trypanosoma rangeli]|uniref:Uncharacterized protein n=1 Tax=Trypanosoma rangeli TaxID=5698 RepID=A0A3S5IRE4_TRYRA|nr:uncharacterized protein TraAM80_04097 [Trypanosoma rangeli]RNF06206.1 hypothetical protein TraAM80_04097 [Trypanosoma rangeli]|eukprot:RNF06206.1 hypothetical protein TraAM80_04097 [Trypanosoma rangeli]
MARNERCLVCLLVARAPWPRNNAFALVMVSASKSFFDGSRCIAGAFRRWAAASSAVKRHCVARHFKISRGGRRHAAALLRGTGSPLLSSVDPAGFPLQHLER